MTWTKDEVEMARSRQLPPLLKDKGYRLVELPSGAFLLASVKGFVIHGHTWFWAAQNLRGNAIDFFMTVEAKTFAEAMELLCPKPPPHNRRPRTTYAADPDDDEDADDGARDDAT